MKQIFVLLIWMISALPLALVSMTVTSTQAVADEYSEDVDEPRFLAGYNRAMFAVNDGLDTVILKPLAKTYHYVLPDPVETGVSNFFSNLGEINNIANDLLQGKGFQAIDDFARLLINTTFGVAGIFDVASNLGIEKSEGEDFGQTLGAYGVDSGPYIVLPLFGPSNLRDAPSRIVDSLANPVRYVDHVPTRNTLYGTAAVSTRVELLGVDEIADGQDKYQFIRDAYMQRRDYLVNDGDVEDDFGSYDDF
ncbi:MAG: MlaA family lipoprotein [bacterium]